MAQFLTMCAKKINNIHPLAEIPMLAPFPSHHDNIPNVSQCMSLWEKYQMMDHIKAHSEQVALMAVSIAERALQCGYNVNVDEVQASALLHDIAKTYTIKYGGNHAQLGASWALTETGSQAIAQGVLFHVHWPWEITEEHICSLPFFIIYADKRIMHHNCVSLKQRYDDLLHRYGHTEKSRQGILLSYRQGQQIENILTEKLDWDIYAYTLNSGRVV